MIVKTVEAMNYIGLLNAIYFETLTVRMQIFVQHIVNWVMAKQPKSITNYIK